VGSGGSPDETLEDLRDAVLVDVMDSEPELRSNLVYAARTAATADAHNLNTLAGTVIALQGDQAPLAEALLEHGGGLPLARLADTLAGLAPRLVIEFVPKEDPQVQRLLGLRRDIFADYTGEGFERAFAGHFRTVERRPLPGTGRVLYLLEAIAR